MTEQNTSLLFDQLEGVIVSRYEDRTYVLSVSEQDCLTICSEHEYDYYGL